MASDNNKKKSNSYALAYERIDKAIAEKFPLEAIAIEESIIADRLISHMASRGISYETFTSTVRIIKDIEEYYKDDEKSKELLTSIKLWCNERNSALHSIVRSKHGDAPKIKHSNFVTSAMGTARRGKKFARAICVWKSRQDTVLKKLAKEKKTNEEQSL